MAILATLPGCQGTDEFRAMIPAALSFDVTPVEIREIVHQAVAYLGIGRVFPFLKITNVVFEEKGISLPLPSQGGCEPQLTSHAAANMRIGNDKAFLIKIISQCLPFIGYPRILNALRCVNDAAAKMEKEAEGKYGGKLSVLGLGMGGIQNVLTQK